VRVTLNPASKKVGLQTLRLGHIFSRLAHAVSISANGITDWDNSVFEHPKKGMHRLHHEIIKNVRFGHKQLKGALRSSFDHVRAYDFTGWSRPKATSGRLFYECW
jgi:hypothetical protein